MTLTRNQRRKLRRDAAIAVRAANQAEARVCARLRKIGRMQAFRMGRQLGKSSLGWLVSELDYETCRVTLTAVEDESNDV